MTSLRYFVSDQLVPILTIAGLAIIALLFLSLSGCAAAASDVSEHKQDSAWIGSDTYEIEAIARGSVWREASGEWTNIARDGALQAQLVDEHLRFAKNGAHEHGYRLNLLADQVEILRVQEDVDNKIRVDYEAKVDFIDTFEASVPTLSDLPSELNVTVPQHPHDIYYRVTTDCSNDEEAMGYNYAYYFDADAPDCTEPMTTIEFEIVDIFEPKRAYPEYDQLRNTLPSGKIGFLAAIVPDTGDYDPYSRYNAHRNMLLDMGGIPDQDAPDNAERFSLSAGNIEIIVDIFDPTEVGYLESFQNALSRYQYVQYNGHSSYGTRELLAEPEAYGDAYQILNIHSCQSYAYYTRQAFRAKRSASDVHGWDKLDVISTGESSYPKGSPKIMRAALEGLAAGLTAIEEGTPEEALDWGTIVEEMNAVEDGFGFSIEYGVAGARENNWQP